MKHNGVQVSVKTLYEEYKAGVIRFDHELQRPSGQWSQTMRSLYVHSIAYGYLLSPVYIIEEDGKKYVVDGVQRLSELFSFMDNEYKLNKNTPLFEIAGLGNYELAGKKYCDLDKVLHARIDGAQIPGETIWEYTESELRETFKRLNTSKPVTPKQLRVCLMSKETNRGIRGLVAHTFFTTVLTPAQIRKGADRDAVIQASMLMLSNDSEKYTSFRSDDIDAFVVAHDEQIRKTLEVLTAVVKLLEHEDCAKYFEGLKIPVTTLPFVLWGACKAVEMKREFVLYVVGATAFVSNIKNKSAGFETYVESTHSNSLNQPNVEVRWDYWKNIVATLPEKGIEYINCDPEEVQLEEMGIKVN